MVSCDPLYRFSASDVRARIDSTFDQIVQQTRANAHEFVWDPSIPSVDALRRVRRAAMNRFLDYESGGCARRYVGGELPALPFADGAFGLALCSHFLFLYTKQLTEDFHVEAARELCRVARDVRIFPLLALGGSPSPYVDAVIQAMRQDGFGTAIEMVPYEFQRGGNRMLRIGRLRERRGQR